MRGSSERGARDRLPETRPFRRPDSADFSDFNADSTPAPVCPNHAVYLNRRSVGVKRCADRRNDAAARRSAALATVCRKLARFADPIPPTFPILTPPPRVFSLIFPTPLGGGALPPKDSPTRPKEPVALAAPTRRRRRTNDRPSIPSLFRPISAFYQTRRDARSPSSPSSPKRPGDVCRPTSTSRQAQAATRSMLSNLLVPAPRRVTRLAKLRSLSKPPFGRRQALRGSSKRRGGSSERGARDRLPETRPFCRSDSADFSDFNAASTRFFANFSNSAWRRRASVQKLADAPQGAGRPCRVDSAASADERSPFDSFSISPNFRVLPNASRRQA